jgi:hypothetical protein
MMDGWILGVYDYKAGMLCYENFPHLMEFPGNEAIPRYLLGSG